MTLMIPALLMLLSLGCAMIYGLWLVGQPPSTVRSAVKTVPVAALAALSAVMGGPLALTLALAFGALGDLCLSRAGTRAFLGGLGAFLLGHLCYVALLAGAGEAATLLAAPWRLLLCLILLGAAAAMLRHITPHLGGLKGPVLGYIVVSVALGGAAATLPLTWPIGFALIGALLFIASDALLAHVLFVARGGEPRWRDLAIWFLYWGGQVLIAAAFLL